jgi:quinol-cytochrome oxidoreductase complex cytochrome b subunit
MSIFHVILVGLIITIVIICQIAVLRQHRLWQVSIQPVVSKIDSGLHAKPEVDVASSHGVCVGNMSVVTLLFFFLSSALS